MTDESVAGAALSTVREQPRLLSFPVLALATTLFLFPLLMRVATDGVGVASRAVAGSLGVPFVVGVPVALYLAVAAVVAVLVSTVAFCNVALVHATDQLRREGDFSVPASLAVAAEAVPEILAYGAFAGAAGPTFVLVERGVGARAARLFGAVAGAPYVAMTYLVGPVVALEERQPTDVFDRSAELLESRFGLLPVVSMSVLETAVFVGAVPLMVVQTAALLDAFTGGSAILDLLTAYPLLTGGLPLVVLWSGVVAGGALGAVAKTDLYAAIEEDLEVFPLLDLPVEDAVSVAGPRADVEPAERAEATGEG